MKYKTNGEWKEITIKAVDSLPYGSVVEYAGSDIPAGWEVIEENIPKIYSGTTEPEEDFGSIGDIYILLEDPEAAAAAQSEDESIEPLAEEE